MGYPHYDQKLVSDIIISVTAPTKTENAPIALYSIRQFERLVKRYNGLYEKKMILEKRRGVL